MDVPSGHRATLDRQVRLACPAAQTKKTAETTELGTLTAQTAEKNFVSVLDTAGRLCNRCAVNAKTPTARTLQTLRAAGWPLVERVERWIPGAGVRRDLFGIGDILAVRDDEVLLVQATTGEHAQDRFRKMAQAPAVPVLCKRGWRLEVWAWRKTGPRGGRKTWSFKRLVVCGLALLASVQLSAAWPSDGFVLSLAFIESGGRHAAIGDHGRSRGAWQLSRAAWQDACRFAGIKANWKTGAHNPVIAERVCRAWLQLLRQQLTRKLGRPPSDLEIYYAHRFGPTRYPVPGRSAPAPSIQADGRRFLCLLQTVGAQTNQNQKNERKTR